MNEFRPLRIGITCYPSVGGSGILATSMGIDLARRGHEVHFICYERPFRLPEDAPRIHFHPVGINAYGLFKYPDYTLPLSVKMAEVGREYRLDVLHVHYAVPHATAAILARAMLPPRPPPTPLPPPHPTPPPPLRPHPGPPCAFPPPSPWGRRPPPPGPAASSASTGRSRSCTTTSSRALRDGRARRCGTSSA